MVISFPKHKQTCYKKEEALPTKETPLLFLKRVMPSTANLLKFRSPYLSQTEMRSKLFLPQF